MAALSVACGGDAPALVLTLRDGPGAPPREELHRLELLLLDCDGGGAPQRLELPVSSPPEGPARVQIEVGARTVAWVRGDRRCDGPCVDEAETSGGECVCEPGQADAAGGWRRVAEACSDALAFEPGLELNLRLGPVQGLCPPSDCR